MKIQVTGWNYEGAHFRGIESATDETLLTITLVGDELDITRAILENFSYGTDEVHRCTLQQLVDGYKNGDISNADGCGWVGRIVRLDDGVELYREDDFEEYVEMMQAADGGGPARNLGEVQATQLAGHNDLNRLVQQSI